MVTFEEEKQKNKNNALAKEEDTQFMLLFSNHPSEHFAVSMDVISRIERIREALTALSARDAGRAERIQLIFSRAFDASRNPSCPL